ncbi:MAG: hypothetical protein AAF661_05060 [Pseudomonadota bacterium]
MDDQLTDNTPAPAPASMAEMKAHLEKMMQEDIDVDEDPNLIALRQNQGTLLQRLEQVEQALPAIDAKHAAKFSEALSTMAALLSYVDKLRKTAAEAVSQAKNAAAGGFAIPAAAPVAAPVAAATVDESALYRRLKTMLEGDIDAAVEKRIAGDVGSSVNSAIEAAKLDRRVEALEKGAGLARRSVVRLALSEGVEVLEDPDVVSARRLPALEALRAIIGKGEEHIADHGVDLRAFSIAAAPILDVKYKNDAGEWIDARGQIAEHLEEVAGIVGEHLDPIMYGLVYIQDKKAATGGTVEGLESGVEYEIDGVAGEGKENLGAQVLAHSDVFAADLATTTFNSAIVAQIATPKAT